MFVQHVNKLVNLRLSCPTLSSATRFGNAAEAARPGSSNARRKTVFPLARARGGGRLGLGPGLLQHEVCEHPPWPGPAACAASAGLQAPPAQLCQPCCRSLPLLGR